MKNISLRAKIFVILGITSLSMIFIIFIADKKLNDSLKSVQGFREKETPLLKTAHKIQYNISVIHREFEELSDTSHKENVNKIFKDLQIRTKLIQKYFDDLEKLSYQKDLVYLKNEVDILRVRFDEFYKAGKRIIEVHSPLLHSVDEDREDGHAHADSKLEHNQKYHDLFHAAEIKIREIGEKLIKVAERLCEQKQSEFAGFIDKIKNQLAFLGMMVLLLLLFISYLITHDILSSLNRLKSGLDEFFAYLNGEKERVFSIKIDSKDEFGQMVKTVNENIMAIEKGLEQDRNFIINVARIVENVNGGDFKDSITQSAANENLEKLKPLINKLLAQVSNVFKDIGNTLNAIAGGDYERRVINDYGGDFDVLKNAANIMGEKLYDRKIENDEQNWIKDGLKGLNEALLDASDIQDVCKRSIDYICNYINAGIGALYTYREEEQMLQQYASYAFVQRENISNYFKLGEGTVGQVALQKSPINLRNIKREHMVIETGTVCEPPLNTYTIPLIYQEKLFGVLEVGSFEIFNNHTDIFLKEADKIIAMAIFSAMQKQKVENLLKDTKKANIMMEKQQQELEKANAEMEEQQQELEKANAEMEEQQQQLMVSQHELREKNDSLEKIRQNIEQASKYKSEFLANMSHELRTPLNSIILLSDLLSKNKNTNLTEKDIEKAVTINKSGNELLRLINDILDLSKVESGKMELVVDRFKSGDLLTEIKDMFEVVANDRGLKFKIEDNYNDYIVNDKDRISQIIRNLISNAFKFTKEGSVTVKFENSGNSDMPVCFSVTDTGIGIPKDKQKLIFEAFKQVDGSTSREYGGTGLGLSISKELVKAMGGEITLSSTYGEGSSFIVNLANLAEEAYEPKTEPEIIKAPVAVVDDSNKIDLDDEVFLIIDDDEVFAKTLYEGIKEKGYNCLIALSGKDGLKKAKEYNVQGIMLDLGLFDIDGVDVLKELKGDLELQGIPVHIISGRDKDSALFKIGAIGYTQKPVLNDDIEAAIKNLACHGKKIIKDLLIVERDIKQRNALKKLIGKNVNIKGVSTSHNAISEIKKGNYDLILVALEFNEGTCEVCEFIKYNYPKLPIIIYANKDEFNDKELEKIQEYSNNIILKTANSEERVLNEIKTFLHTVECNEEEVEYEDDIDLEGMTILVADDDIKNIFVLDTALSEYGANIVRAKNGKAAIEKIKENDNIDIILMDIMMPVMDGYEAIQKIRKDETIKKDIPIIAVTAKAMKEDKNKCLKAGADEYISKPIDMSKLLQLVKIWAGKKYK